MDFFATLRTISSKKKTFFIAFLILWALVTCYLIFFFISSPKKANSDREAVEIKKKLSKFISFGEADPSIATISDAEALKQVDQFYNQAKNGDKLIIWEEKALIYRPGENKIVDFGIVLQPKNPDSETNQPTSVQNKARVLILNGTQRAGLAKTLQQQFESTPDLQQYISTIKTADAKNKSSADSSIIDLSGGKYPDLVLGLSQSLPATVGQLPDEELKPENTDILIIVGESLSI